MVKFCIENVRIKSLKIDLLFASQETAKNLQMNTKHTKDPEILKK